MKLAKSTKNGKWMVMAMREKLIELLDDNAQCSGVLGISDCETCPYGCEKNCYTSALVDHLIANGVTIQKWIPVTERLPKNFISVLGYMTDAGDFPPVRECYTVGNSFFFPALGDVHPVSHWMPLPEPPKEV